MDGIIHFLHLLAATIWIGGGLFLNFIFSPIFRTFQFAEQAEIAGKITGRFALFAWPSVAVLLITGFYKLPQGVIGNISNFYSIIFNLKLILVSLMIGLGLYLTGYLGLKMKKISAATSPQASSEIRKLRTIMPIISMSIVLLGVTVIFLISII